MACQGLNLLVSWFSSLLPFPFPSRLLLRVQHTFAWPGPSVPLPPLKNPLSPQPVPPPTLLAGVATEPEPPIDEVLG